MNDEPAPATESERPPTKRWQQHAVWIGPVLTIVGALSYFLYFYQFPALRDFPVLNLPIVLLGLAFTSVGCWQMFKQRGRLLAKAFASIGLLLSLGVGGMFVFYVFFFSYGLPSVAAVPDLQATPADFSLPDQNGQQVSMADYRNSKIILVFYRGFW